MRKKALYSFVAIALSSFALSSCGGNSSNKSNVLSDVTFYSALNSLNIMLDQSEPSEKKIDMSIDGTKGEVESIQLIMNSPNRDIKKYFVEVSDFVNGDNIISAENVEILVEKYIETQRSSNRYPTTADMTPGFYPDALVPYRKIVKKQENNISRYDNQGIWFNVSIPETAVSGDYEANIKVTMDGQEKNIPFKLHVYELNMSKVAHQKRYYGLWYSYLKHAIHIPLTEKTFENYYWYLAKKRLTPGDLPMQVYRFDGATPEAQEWVDYMVDFAKSDIVPSYNLPCRYVTNETYGKILDVDYLESILTKLIDKNISLYENGDYTDLFKKLYIYAWGATDEPKENEAEYARIKYIDKTIVDVKASLASRLDDYPELKESFNKIGNVVTVARVVDGFVGDDTTGGIQTWCPLVSDFNKANYKSLMEERRNNSGRVSGEDFWWYNCVTPENPFPTYQLDDNLLSSRVMQWMKYDYKVSGDLYWCANFWRKCLNNSLGIYENRDVWDDPESFEGANGDGSIIYPGADYGLDEPIGTLRLESVREGSEDYEYLYMFNEVVNNININYSKSYDTDKILRHFFDAIGRGTIPFCDSDFDLQINNAETFKNNRSELLILLEKMVNSPESSFARLDELNK